MDLPLHPDFSASTDVTSTWQTGLSHTGGRSQTCVHPTCIMLLSFFEGNRGNARMHGTHWPSGQPVCKLSTSVLSSSGRARHSRTQSAPKPGTRGCCLGGDAASCAFMHNPSYNPRRVGAGHRIPHLAHVAAIRGKALRVRWHSTYGEMVDLLARRLAYSPATTSYVVHGGGATSVCPQMDHLCLARGVAHTRAPCSTCQARNCLTFWMAKNLRWATSWQGAEPAAALTGGLLSRMDH